MDPMSLVRSNPSPVALLANEPSSRKSRFLSKFSAIAFAFAFLLAGSQLTLAQGAASVQFQAPIPLVASPSPSNPNGPYGLAFDNAGDLFVADFRNNRVVEIPAGCTNTTCQVTLPTSGLYGPTGLAVDGTGNVFISDTLNNRVVELPWTGSGYGAQQTLLSTTSPEQPNGIAVDQAGDVFIAIDNFSTSPSTSSVVELPWTGSGYGTPVTVVSWLKAAWGLAFDATGDLFVTDYVDNLVVKVPKGCSASSCAIVLSSGASTEPTSISVDQAGDVFTSYFTGNEVIELPAGCSSSTCQVLIGSGLNKPLGVALDGTGNIFVADYGNNQIEKIRQNNLKFGAVSVGSSVNETAYITFNSAVTLNSTTPYSVLTQGGEGLDFTDGGSSTCSGTSYTSGQACTVNIQFAPQAAGSVAGALTLLDASGTAVATGYISGTGLAPQLTYLPGTESAIGSGLLSSNGVAVDREGNIFVADSANRAIEELVAPGYTTTKMLGGSFSFTNPVGVALDGAGNVFVADTGSGAIEEIMAPAYATVNAIGSGFSGPSGVAVDGEGNVYVADTGNDAVKEILAASGYATINTLGNSFSAPEGVAVDDSGNVFVADTGNNAVKEIVAVNGSIPASPTIKTLRGFSAPAGVTVDNLGNVYVADTGNDVVEELTAVSGFATASTLGSGFGGPSGVAVDSSGNVYVGSSADTQVVKFDYADPPTLNFAASTGSTSSPQTVTVTNYGNADLTFATPASGTNPSVSSDFTINPSPSTGTPCPVLSSTSSPATLAMGSSCVDELTFSSPTSGSTSGSMVITDDDLNMTGSTQTILLNGTSATVTIAPGSLPAAQVGTAYSQTITASGGTAPYSYSVTSGSLPAGLTLSSDGTLSGTPTAGGSFSFSVTAKDANSIPGSLAYSLTVSAPTITIAPLSLPAAQVNLPYSQTLSASGGTAPYSFAVTSGALPAGLTLSSAGVLSGTPTASGTFTFTVTATDSSTGTGAPFSAVDSYTLTVNASTITLAPTSLPSGQVGQAYTLVSLTAIGGTAPYSYSVTTGSLPAGLTLSSAGVLSGTPTAGGSFSFTVTATDANSITGSQAYSITASAPAITVSPSSLLAAQVNASYSQTLTASGGTAPYSFAVTSGTLPTGLTFDGASATFSGTPTVGGSFAVTVTVTDSSTGTGPYTAPVNLTLTVNPGTATLTFAPIPPQTYGNAPFTVSASSPSSGTITYSIASGPATINSTTGSVTLNGAGVVTIEATQVATASYTSTVAQTPLSVAKQSSATTITASSSSAGTGQSITLTAAVAPLVTGSPTGTVSFMDGGTQLGTAVTLTNGTAQLTTSNLPSGNNVISAVYSGDNNFLESSATLSSPIVISSSDFSFTVSGAADQTINPGGTASFNFALAPTSTNYPDIVTFSVHGLPASATGSLSVTSVPSTAGPQTITLTVKSLSGSASNNTSQNPGRHFNPLALALLLPFLGLPGLRLKRRKLLRGLRLLALVAAACLASWSLSGCGSVSGILGHGYSVAVTATSGTVQHTAFVDLSVK